MRLISDNSQLCALLPNVITSVAGEKPLFDKVYMFLDIAEIWAAENLTSEIIFNKLCDSDESSTQRMLLSQLVVADALRLALPSLDVVLSPNGFAVINTSNLAPASAHRVDNLDAAMLEIRDLCIGLLLSGLRTMPEWLSTKQAAFFAGSLFPELSVVDALKLNNGSKWDRYLELRPEVIRIEDRLAQDWFSPELMSVLREHNLQNSLSEKEAVVLSRLKPQIIRIINTGDCPLKALADIVQFIRINPDDFPAWHSSATAGMFSPPVFVNKKSASGYFF